MAIRGDIYLVYNEAILRKRDYLGLVERKHIIQEWGKIYGKKFSECAIQIAPEVTLGINEDGTNKRFNNIRK